MAYTHTMWAPVINCFIDTMNTLHPFFKRIMKKPSDDWRIFFQPPTERNFVWGPHLKQLMASHTPTSDSNSLSGWWCTYPSEKYESMGRIIPYIMENMKCSKPPTSYGFHEKSPGIDPRNPSWKSMARGLRWLPKS